MKQITLEELLEAGCHFGHQVTRQNPKARDFVFEARDNIHIIDLGKTKEGLEEAAGFIKSIALKGGNIVIVGTKRQAGSLVKEEIQRAHDAGAGTGLFSVTYRWIGGTLTNIGEVVKNYKKLSDLTRNLQSDSAKEGYTKREVLMWEREKNKLELFYGGMSGLTTRPDALFIIDTHTENLAVREAKATGVKVVGIVDTNADPDPIDIVIPANDDAVGSVKLILSYIVDAWIEGRKEFAKTKEEEEQKTAKEAEKAIRAKADAIPAPSVKLTDSFGAASNAVAVAPEVKKAAEVKEKKPKAKTTVKKSKTTKSE